MGEKGKFQLSNWEKKIQIITPPGRENLQEQEKIDSSRTRLAAGGSSGVYVATGSSAQRDKFLREQSSRHVRSTPA